MDERIRALAAKAGALPLLPGVYIMRDADDTVIYVGKAKALRNRVSSYFHGEHLPKVAAMVSHVRDFSVIVAESEFEALVLENSLIKRHQPHYNILLRDDKTYPFIRLDLRESWPRFSVVGRPADDGARYFGPYGGRSVAFRAIDTLGKTLGFPSCRRRFPQDIGRGRPCLNRQMGLCAGWCAGAPDETEYRRRLQTAIRVLDGGTDTLVRELEGEMTAAAEALRFERAAELRDRLAAVKELSNRQSVLRAGRPDTDVFAFHRGARCAFVVLHYTDGALAGKELELLPEPLEDDAAALEALVCRYYTDRPLRPREVLLPLEPEDREGLERWLTGEGRRVRVYVPQRGARRTLTEAALRNAREESLRASTAQEKRGKTLDWLRERLALPERPRRIEAFDVSNTGSVGIVAAMTVFQDGRPLKRDYRRFRMRETDGPDDYASMYEAIRRRFRRYLDGDEKFAPLPQLLLIDGGAGQVRAAQSALGELGLSVPTYGMVKDDRHRTRALMSGEGEEIGLRDLPALFAFVGTIQEETHRFAIEYHRLLRDGRISSALDDIPGIGPKRRGELLRAFHSVRAVSAASEEELAAVVPRSAAHAVYVRFHPDADGKESTSCE